MTAQEIRERILDVVGQNGGHLSSSLGAVEIAMALAEIFDPMTDRIVWDVGHQAYAWKILTDRGGRDFSTLRKLDGVSPFPNPAESAADAAVAGHAGVSISVAAGLAAARDARGSSEHVIAVVGDGALVNGTSFEALNNLAASTKKLIVILNDNEMSISRPAGSFAKLLGRLITNVRYNRVKTAAENAGHKMKLTFLRGIYHKVEGRIKSWFLGNAYFEQFGLRYVGPVDGHDLAQLKDAFTVAKEYKRSVIVHVVTKKGKGYEPAEKDPTRFHGVSAGQISEKSKSEEQGEVVVGSRSRTEDIKSSAVRLPTTARTITGLSWSDAFGSALCEAALKDERIVALTAGMKDGTGLAQFAKVFRDRFFDVGIAEGHMVAFAAGMAAGGRRPVVAVYSTFLQRAIDQVMHDVCLSNLPVVFCVDRAGAVGADGVTHQGLYDIAMLRTLPNLTICQPKDAEDLKALLDEALKRNGPTVIRYPRGVAARKSKSEGVVVQRNDENSTVRLPTTTTAISIWATGDQLEKAYSVAARIPDAEVVFARYLKPFDAELLKAQRTEGRRIVSIENGAIAGGFGEAIGADLKFGWPDEFIPHGSVAELENRYGFDVESIASAINRTIEQSEQSGNSSYG